MKFSFFNTLKKKKIKVSELQRPVSGRLKSSRSSPPQIYRGVTIYESESDRFGSFDEDISLGEYPRRVKPRKIIPPPKTPPRFFAGILCGVIIAFSIFCGITFVSLFSKFGGIHRVVKIPSLVNMNEEAAISILNSAPKDFTYEIEYAENPNVPHGSIISQAPNPNAERKLYGLTEKIKIKLTVSKSSEPITLPELCGAEFRIAELELKNAGINVITKEAYSDSVAIGNVISCSHRLGSKLYSGDTVTLTVSLGKRIAYTNVPSLVGLSESEAIALIKRQRLTLSEVSYELSELPIGTVIKQSVDAGASVRELSVISFSVSAGSRAE